VTIAKRPSAGRGERTSASDLPDAATDIFGFREFVKTELMRFQSASR